MALATLSTKMRLLRIISIAEWKDCKSRQPYWLAVTFHSSWYARDCMRSRCYNSAPTKKKRHDVARKRECATRNDTDESWKKTSYCLKKCLLDETFLERKEMMDGRDSAKHALTRCFKQLKESDTVRMSAKVLSRRQLCFTVSFFSCGFSYFIDACACYSNLNIFW